MYDKLAPAASLGILDFQSPRPGSLPPPSSSAFLPPSSRLSLAPISLPAPSWDGEVMSELEVSLRNLERLSALKQHVHGRRQNMERLRWQYLACPQRDGIRLFGVERGDELVAATARMSMTLCVRGKEFAVDFNMDSAVHPSLQREGKMRRLYRLAGQHAPRARGRFSKGASEQIAPLLAEEGYQDLSPSTYLVCYPSATRWLMSRLRMRFEDHLRSSEPPRGFSDFEPVHRFDEGVDELFEAAAPGFDAIFRRDAAYMNWRYMDIPDREYLCFQRTVDGKVRGVVVLSHDGPTANIVDLLWDPARQGDHLRLVQFARVLLDERLAVRVLCFATHPRLREALEQVGFLDKGMSPGFRARLPPALSPFLAPGSTKHFTDGDGDTEL